MNFLVEVENLNKVYCGEDRKKISNLLVLDNVSFHVHNQEFICVLGPSGCGKSTLLNVISGLDEDYSGNVKVHGCDEEIKSKKTKIGYIFQEPRLLPWLTIEQNIHFVLNCQNIQPSKMHEISNRYLQMVGLAGFEKKFPHQLSGGMQQRASIARSLSVEPTLLLMDEPFSGLDELTARILRRELLEIWSETKITVVFVTHNPLEATFLADRIIIMTSRPGKILEEVNVDISRPRSYEDLNVFEFYRELVLKFFKNEAW